MVLRAWSVCVVALVVSTFGRASVAGTCPGAGDCCMANGTPGCNDFDCCDFVCFIDDLCCVDQWDETCAGFAQFACPELCGTGCPGSGDCCAGNGTPGCEDLICCEAVCSLDPSCCDSGWSAACAALAEQVCTACASPFDCPGEGECCAANGTPGCDDAACCEAVCSLDPRCCQDEWSDDCAVTANLFCGAVGEEYCSFCPGTESCCEIHDTPGCNRQACCNLVCGLDATCCTERWSHSCRREAIDSCAATVCDCELPGDFDEDGRVTLSDVAEFMNCFQGPTATPLEPACACADFNGDGLADRRDTGALSFALTGPN